MYYLKIVFKIFSKHEILKKLTEILLRNDSFMNILKIFCFSLSNTFLQVYQNISIELLVMLIGNISKNIL